MNERSARALLGVSPSATVGQIKRAYRRLALDLHPDRGGDAVAFQRLVEAQRLLLASSPVAAPPQRAADRRWVDTASPRGTRVATDIRPVRRRPANYQVAESRRFGDVLAEKLAAA